MEGSSSSISRVVAHFQPGVLQCHTLHARKLFNYLRIAHSSYLINYYLNLIDIKFN
jgi:hypothetical protein